MTKIAVLLTQGFADWEYALIGGAGRSFYDLDVQYFSPDTGEVSSMGGLRAVVSQDLDALSGWKPDVVVVVGGTIWETAEAPEIGPLLAGLHEGGAAVGGICAGTLAVARAGLLNDVQHTSNAADFLVQNVEDYKGAARYQDSASAVSASRVITAPGTAPVSFTAAVLEAAGVPDEAIAKFRGALSAEHG